MNVDEAINAHQQWKVKLRMFINGDSPEPLDPAVVSRDNQCELGKWLAGPGMAFASQPSFAAVKSAHTQFHSQAGQVVKMVVAGNKPGAEGILNGTYLQTSSNVVLALRKLRDEMS